MSLRFLTVLSLVLVGVFVLPSESSVACERTYFVRVSDAYPPYAERDADGHFSGIDVDIVRKVFGHAGCGYSFVTVPWKAALLDLAKGNLDAVATASRTKERDIFALFSMPYRSEQNRLIIRRGDRRFDNLQNLEQAIQRQLVLGFQSGTFRGDEFAALLGRYQSTPYISELVDPEHSVKLVVLGRLDAYAEEVETALAYAKNFGLTDKIEIHPYVLSNSEIHFMFSRETVTPDDVSLINASIKAMLPHEGS